MITGRMYNFNDWNHASQLASSDYWYGVFYDLIIRGGLSRSQAEARVKKPTLKNRINAYERGLAQAIDEQNRLIASEKQRLKELENARLAAQAGNELGFHTLADGSIWDLKTGRKVREAPQTSTDTYEEKENNNTMLYILAGVALFLLFLIFKRKKKT